MWRTIYHRLVRETLVPLALMVVTPNAAVLLPYIVVHKKADLIGTFRRQSVPNLLRQIWSSVNLFDLECWMIICATFLWAMLSLVAIPGKKYYGPLTANNFRPTYWDNGFRFYLISMAFVVPIIWHTPVLHLYYKIPDLVAILAITGIAFCTFLYLKGVMFPDPGIYDMTGNPIFDFYWGIELYPHLGKYISLKVLINSRFGLWLWQLIVLICWKAHYELYHSHFSRGNIFGAMTVTTILQTVYLAKFYYWEDGYMQTIDICVDRFGYMIAWGCMAFVPGYFTLGSLYMVKNAPSTSFTVNFLILVAGLVAIFGNYWSDRQRQIARQTDGQCLIWWEKPRLIRAKYRDANGQEHNALLLASGFWGIARHFNYCFEILIALSFGLPALATSLIPYLYFLFIVVLLIHRSHRDDRKCLAKYGRYWHEYRKLVPYQILPYIF